MNAHLSKWLLIVIGITGITQPVAGHDDAAWIHDHSQKAYIGFYQPKLEELALFSRIEQLEKDQGISRKTAIFHTPQAMTAVFEFIVQRDGVRDEAASRTRTVTTRPGEVYPITLTRKSASLFDDKRARQHVNIGNKAYFSVAQSFNQKQSGFHGWAGNNLRPDTTHTFATITSNGDQAFELTITVTLTALPADK